MRPFLARSSVLVRCDNMIIVSAVNSRTVKSPAINLIQLLFLAVALDDIEIKAEWISSEDNWIADALSHFQFKKIVNLFPQFHASSLRH